MKGRGKLRRVLAVTALICCLMNLFGVPVLTAGFRTASPWNTGGILRSEAAVASAPEAERTSATASEAGTAGTAPYKDTAHIDPGGAEEPVIPDIEITKDGFKYIDGTDEETETYAEIATGTLSKTIAGAEGPEDWGDMYMTWTLRETASPSDADRDASPSEADKNASPSEAEKESAPDRSPAADAPGTGMPGDGFSEDALSDTTGEPVRDEALVRAGTADSSGYLNDFLIDIEIRDEDGNLVSAKDIKPGKKYTITLKFKEWDEQEKIFRPATKEELEAAGITEDEYGDGLWMYILLGDDVSAEPGAVSSDGKVKATKDGKALLVHYEGDEQHQMDSCDVTFTIELEEGANPDNLDVLEGDKGNWTPPAETDPYVQKIGKYNPDTGHIEYTIRVCNPGAEELTDVTLTDLFTDSETGSMSSLVEGSVRFGTNEVPADRILTEDGKTTLTGIGPVPPGSCVEVTYELDVSEQARDLSKTETFYVDNTVTMQADGHPDDSDTAKTDVHRPSLDKIGYGNGEFWGVKPTARWEIRAYDPYNSLENGVITDTLPPGITFSDIVGALFIDETGERPENLKVYVDNGAGTSNFEELLKYMHQGKDEHEVVFEFDKMPPELKEKVFANGGHELRLDIVTRVPHAGEYENTVTAEMPSDQGASRSDTCTATIISDGVHVDKYGHLAENGKDMIYEIDMSVGAGIADSDQNPLWRMGAGIYDILTLTDGNITTDLDFDEGMTVESVVAEYDDGSWVFTEDTGEPGHVFAVRAVGFWGEASDGYFSDYEKQGQTDRANRDTIIVLNPVYGDRNSGITVDGQTVPYPVHGEWPEELVNEDVVLHIKYRLDPEKVYFINGREHTQLEECDNLAQYLALKKDITLTNKASGAVRSSSSYGDNSHNLVVPVEKKGVDTVDLAEGEKYINYEVTFRNGKQNDGAIPVGATGITFHDSFGEYMEYVKGTLTAKAGGLGAEPETYTFTGTDTFDGEITALWSEFVSESSGQSLQDVFNSFSTDFTVTFSYRLQPGAGMPSDQARVSVTNTAWMDFNESYETNRSEATVEFPTGVLTKEAALENGGVSFYIEINEGARDLDPLSEFLTVRDTPSDMEYLHAEADSLIVEEFMDGKWVELTEGVEKTVNPDGSFVLKVPDGKHLRLHCRYVLDDNTPSGADVRISNSVIIEGQDALADGDNWKFNESEIRSSHTESSNTKFRLRKVRLGDETVTVAGARFILYAHNLTGTDNTAALKEAEESGLPTEYIYENRDYYPAVIYETGPDGTAEVNWTLLKSGVTYLLGESYVPEGYGKLQDLIVLKADEDGNVSIISGGDGKVSADGNMVTVENPYLPDALSLPLTGGPGTAPVLLLGFTMCLIGAGAAVSAKNGSRGKEHGRKK